MKKNVLLSICLSLYSLFYSQKYVFIPNLEKNRIYTFKISKSEFATDEFDQKMFSYENNYKVNYSILEELNNHYICSWKIMFYEKRGKEIPFYSGFYDFLEGLEIKIKTTINGEYIGIVNLAQLKLQIKDFITEDYIKNFKQKSKKNKNYVIRLLEIKKNPEKTILSLEDDILKYFRYYNISFHKQDKANTIRKNFPFYGYVLPYQLKIDFEKSNDGFLFIVENKVDIGRMKDENWDSIYTGVSNKLDEFKESYGISVIEKYCFSNSGNVYKIEICGKEKMNYVNNYVRYSNFALSLE